MHFDAALLCSYNLVQFFILSSRKLRHFTRRFLLQQWKLRLLPPIEDDALMPPEATKRFFWYNLSFHVKTFGWSAKKWNDDTCIYKLQKKIVSIRFDEKKKREMKPDNFLLIVIKAYKSKISFWSHEKVLAKFHEFYHTQKVMPWQFDENFESSMIFPSK